MVIKDLVKDEAALSMPAETATAQDAGVAQDLLDTMNHLGEECLCLAANQIGSNKAVIIVRDKLNDLHIMFNPKIKQTKTPYTVKEGCLSLERETEVVRYRFVKVAYEELVDGQLRYRVAQYKDWVAEAVLHAIDHCDGKLV